MGEVLLDRESRLHEIGIALSQERNIMRLLEKILDGASELTQADGATIYTVTAENALKFQIMKTQSLNVHLGGEKGTAVPFADIPLKQGNGSNDDRFTVTYAVNHHQTVSIHDAYIEQGFDFSRTKEFDKKTGYRTRSVLVVPIYDHEGTTISVLQLINPRSGEAFTPQDKQVAESLASQAGVALTNQKLINDLRSLFESLIDMLAKAVDKKSPVTGRHAERVPKATMMLAEAVNESGYAKFSDAELYELKVAALLHDCGKITTPQYILEKRNKLEEVCDLIVLVDKQIDLFKKDLEIAHLKGELDEATWKSREAEAEKARLFLHTSNQGGNSDLTTLETLYHQGLITDTQFEHLKVIKGNLNDTERKMMQNHVVMTKEMLLKLRYPKELQKVPAIAGAHHEHLDGKGYPDGLTAKDLSLPMRILAMSDVFEALSAPDRPYKPKHPLSKILDIMAHMCAEGHLDPQLFAVFVSQKVYLRYAKQFLTPEQIDIT